MKTASTALKKIESTLSERCVQLSIVVGLLFYFNVIIFKYLDRFLVRNFENITGYKFSSEMLAVVHTVLFSLIFYFICTKYLSVLLNTLKKFKR